MVKYFRPKNVEGEKMEEENNDIPQIEGKKPVYSWNQAGLIFIALLITFLAGMYLTPQDSFLDSGMMQISECKNSYARSYGAGVQDNLIRTMNSFIENCTPSNPEAFIRGDVQGNIKGVLLRCNSTEGNISYLPVDYVGKR